MMLCECYRVLSPRLLYLQGKESHAKLPSQMWGQHSHVDEIKSIDEWPTFWGIARLFQGHYTNPTLSRKLASTNHHCHHHGWAWWQPHLFGCGSKGVRLGNQHSDHYGTHFSQTKTPWYLNSSKQIFWRKGIFGRCIASQAKWQRVSLLVWQLGLWPHCAPKATSKLDFEQVVFGL